MERKLKLKLRTKWLKFIEGVREYAPAIGLGVGGGMLIGGYFGAIKNGRDIEHLNQRVDQHSRLINQHADAGNSLVEKVYDQEKQLQELTRQNALLMEQAIKTTEGKG